MTEKEMHHIGDHEEYNDKAEILLIERKNGVITNLRPIREGFSTEVAHCVIGKGGRHKMAITEGRVKGGDSKESTLVSARLNTESSTPVVSEEDKKTNPDKPKASNAFFAELAKKVYHWKKLDT